MVSMSPSVQLEAGFKGGLGKTFGRMLGGESLIINTFTAANETCRDSVLLEVQPVTSPTTN